LLGKIKDFQPSLELPAAFRALTSGPLPRTRCH
jgi:hypothetical protein